MTKKTPLRLACEHIMEIGIDCPLNICEWCDQTTHGCRGDQDAAACWERFFKEKAEESK